MGKVTLRTTENIQHYSIRAEERQTCQLSPMFSAKSPGEQGMGKQQ